VAEELGLPDDWQRAGQAMSDGRIDIGQPVGVIAFAPFGRIITLQESTLELLVARMDQAEQHLFETELARKRNQDPAPAFCIRGFQQLHELCSFNHESFVRSAKGGVILIASAYKMDAS
jgi:hypothetical protein